MFRLAVALLIGALLSAASVARAQDFQPPHALSNDSRYARAGGATGHSVTLSAGTPAFVSTSTDGVTIHSGNLPALIPWSTLVGVQCTTVATACYAQGWRLVTPTVSGFITDAGAEGGNVVVSGVGACIRVPAGDILVDHIPWKSMFGPTSPTRRTRTCDRASGLLRGAPCTSVWDCWTGTCSAATSASSTDDQRGAFLWLISAADNSCFVTAAR